MRGHERAGRNRISHNATNSRIPVRNETIRRRISSVKIEYLGITGSTQKLVGDHFTNETATRRISGVKIGLNLNGPVRSLYIASSSMKQPAHISIIEGADTADALNYQGLIRSPGVEMEERDGWTNSVQGFQGILLDVGE